MAENPEAKLNGLHKKLVRKTSFHLFVAMSYYYIFILLEVGSPKQNILFSNKETD